MKTPIAETRSLLCRKGFTQSAIESSFHTFENPNNQTCIIIDTTICTDRDLQYVDYTSHQNERMHNFTRLFRFLFEPGDSAEKLKDEINVFLEEEPDPDSLRNRGLDRSKEAIDPTLPEAIFEECFIEAFGNHHRNTLHREFQYYDNDGKERYIDYVIFGEENFAFELNGEQFHHPCAIGSKKYRSQLLKQNSLIRDGFKVFRWSKRGMDDREKFILDLKRYLGDPNGFLLANRLKCNRPGDVQTIEIEKANIPDFDLYRHQEQCLEIIDQRRREGKNIFLIVLPTGTGKTEIFLHDIQRLKNAELGLKALVLVPTRNLRSQTINRFESRLPQFRHLVSENPLESNGDIFVQTYSWIQRNYFKLSQGCFDYIVVDEAHHAVATGLRRVLEHFTPSHLLGVTATPERFDQKRLEEIFGEYESLLTLEEAIKRGNIPPIRCYRIQSNIDLSQVRFNGREYVKSDLQRTLHVLSRDVLIVNILRKYFSGELSDKQGVIFCVDIEHAKRMAKLMEDHGITALAVNGRERKESVGALKLYSERKVRFLCACDLLTEGWDAPQTSILVMARPTFSQVLYTQQLGRGLRHYPEKEALYVLDVVDNYGPRLQPLSLNALFGVGEYCPFDLIVDPEQPVADRELVVLDGLYEGERRIEPIDIFSFEKMYGDHLNEEQLARELFVSTGTVKSWLKKGDIQPDVQYPFGKSMLSFFHPDQLSKIREQKGLKLRSQATRRDDFWEFIEERDYTFSFKIVFLLGFLKLANNRGEASLPDLVAIYQRFYKGLLVKYGKNDRPKCPYNRMERWVMCRGFNGVFCEIHSKNSNGSDFSTTARI